MNTDAHNPWTAEPGTPEQRAALASPLRLEIVGLFTSGKPLSIREMAERMGRTAGSLYHHVAILEEAGLLRRTGTRPKGKRYEALFEPGAAVAPLHADPEDADSIAETLKAAAAAFRMTERDLEAALHRSDLATEGPDRNVFVTRVHMRIPARTLARLNKHLEAIQALLTSRARARPAPNDQLLSLTLALLPLRGRDGTPQGD